VHRGARSEDSPVGGRIVAPHAACYTPRAVRDISRLIVAIASCALLDAGCSSSSPSGPGDVVEAGHDLSDAADARLGVDSAAAGDAAKDAADSSAAHDAVVDVVTSTDAGASVDAPVDWCTSLAACCPMLPEEPQVMACYNADGPSHTQAECMSSLESWQAMGYCE
jgi:hypothetical protein